MDICFNEMLYAFSTALDAVERDLLGVSTQHAQRIAYISVRMGKHSFNLDEKQLSDLAACAMLHDNALTEYIHEEYGHGNDVLDREHQEINFGVHCLMGEENVKSLPFFGDVTDVIKYHHENADGTGPFGKLADEIPLFAGIIHIADQLDAVFDFSVHRQGRFEELQAFLTENSGKLYTEELVQSFREVFTEEELDKLAGPQILDLLKHSLRPFHKEYSSEQIYNFAGVFARIIDYKSRNTRRHSIGVAEICRDMGAYYGWSEERQAQIYLAGALHDIGKVFVDTEIIEKPGPLTREEFAAMKEHSKYAADLLYNVSGLEDITSWVELHHEKLDGSGYPHGTRAEDLGFEARLIACADIFRALTEDRPYKKAVPNKDAIGILREMVEEGLLDGAIVQDIEKVYLNTAA